MRENRVKRVMREGGLALARVAQAVTKSGVTRFALPMNNGVLPRDAKQLRELGVSYANCFPAPETRLLRSFQAQVTEARKLLA